MGRAEQAGDGQPRGEPFRPVLLITGAPAARLAHLEGEGIYETG
jgi:hypothetical protein